jgi:RNA polymerase sigma-70 factor (ECF subfamily)
MVTAHLQLVPKAPLSDDDLVRALRSGDTRASAPFYERTRPVVSRAVLRLLRSATDHDELVQLTMIELMLTIGRFRGQCSLDSWCSTLAAHVVFKQLRQRKRERLIFSALGDDGPGHHVPAPGGNRPLQRNLLERLRTLLESIDRAKAEVFVLHDVHGYDLKETSEILGISISNAQTRLVRGRKALHDQLRGDAELCAALNDFGGSES